MHLLQRIYHKTNRKYGCQSGINEFKDYHKEKEQQLIDDIFENF